METLEALEAESKQALDRKRDTFQKYVDEQKAKGTFNAKEFAEWNDFNYKNLTLKHKFAVVAKYTVLPAIAGVVAGIIGGPGLGIIISISGVSGLRMGFRNNARHSSALTIDSNGHLYETPEKRKLFGKIKLPSF